MNRNCGNSGVMSMILNNKFIFLVTYVFLISCGKGNGLVEVQDQTEALIEGKKDNKVNKPTVSGAPAPSSDADATTAQSTLDAAEAARDEAAQAAAQAAAEAEAAQAEAALTAAEADAAVAAANQAAAEAETFQADAEAEAAQAKAAQAAAEAEAAQAKAAQAAAEAEAAEAIAAQAAAEAEAAEITAAIADPKKYVFDGKIYDRRSKNDTDDCDSSIECEGDRLCITPEGFEENQASTDDKFPHNGDPNRPSASYPGAEQCR